jgi:very-short-patch-repair endonuclease
MRVPNIVIGQQVDPAKLERARELRKRMTPEERLLWQHLRDNRLVGLHFRRSQVIDGFIADFYCHATGVVLEVDGKVHDYQPDYDRERDAILRRRGLRVLRLKNEELREDVDAVLEKISRFCRDAALIVADEPE